MADQVPPGIFSVPSWRGFLLARPQLRITVEGPRVLGGGSGDLGKPVSSCTPLSTSNKANRKLPPPLHYHQYILRTPAVFRWAFIASSPENLNTAFLELWLLCPVLFPFGPTWLGYHIWFTKMVVGFCFLLCVKVLVFLNF